MVNPVWLPQCPSSPIVSPQFAGEKADSFPKKANPKLMLTNIPQHLGEACKAPSHLQGMKFTHPAANSSEIQPVSPHWGLGPLPGFWTRLVLALPQASEGVFSSPFYR